MTLNTKCDHKVLAIYRSGIYTTRQILLIFQNKAKPTTVYGKLKKIGEKVRQLWNVQEGKKLRNIEKM